MALKLLSGGSASLAAVDDLHLATNRDLNLVLGQKLNAAGHQWRPAGENSGEA
ncbi:hypothetical protein [Pseudomonas fluorescens]|uniref:hypothetical protein n=1 Tax=Pseudomonas fluorescens TaxID=294 RepID=UPI001BEBA703|nr:hypothetical protein [Pseudomonas fluorescens]MBT2375410.1 hypothetical protein [Pseudomonas fluorescens]